MAKGKGKGKGNDAGDCCGWCCLILLLPPIMIVAGIVMLVMGNTRVQRIKDYNTRATEWKNTGLAFFKDKTFTVADKAMTAHTATTGLNYPVRDTCKKDGDPKEGCVYTDALYYESSVPLANKVDVNIKDATGKSIISNQYDYNSQKKYNPSDLGCNEDTSKCPSKCTEKGGYWNSASLQCTVDLYLSEICVRVTFKNEAWVVDNPPTYTLSGSGYGCYYSSYDITRYTKSAPGSTIPVSVRYYKDSFIAAEEFTHGCSSTSSSSTECFGMSRKEQNKTGLIIMFIGIGFFALEIAIVVGMCMCCSSTLKAIFKKK